MKIELIKYENDNGATRWKVVNNGQFIVLYTTEQEGIEGFDKYVARLQEPPTEPQIIKSIEL